MTLLEKILNSLGISIDDMPRDELATLMMWQLPPGAIVTSWVEED